MDTNNYLCWGGIGRGSVRWGWPGASAASFIHAQISLRVKLPDHYPGLIWDPISVQGVAEGDTSAVPRGTKEGQKHPNPPAHWKAQRRGPQSLLGAASKPQGEGAVGESRLRSSDGTALCRPERGSRLPSQKPGGSRLPRDRRTQRDASHRPEGSRLPWHRPEGSPLPPPAGTPLLRLGGSRLSPDRRDTAAQARGVTVTPGQTDTMGRPGSGPTQPRPGSAALPAAAAGSAAPLPRAAAPRAHTAPSEKKTPAAASPLYIPC